MSDLSDAVVKNDLQLGTDGDLPEEYSTVGYAAAGEFLDEYETKDGKDHHKEGVYAGAGVLQVTTGNVEFKGLHAGAGVQVSSEKEIKAVAKAETISVGNDDINLKGPKAGTGCELSLKDGAKAMVEAKLDLVSGSVGPLSGTLAAGALDTGVGIGKSGVEAKVLGTGFSIGRKTGISVFGSGFEIDFGKIFK